MSDYLIIDAHVHTYPSPEIGLQAKQGHTHSSHCGTIEELVGIMEKGKIWRAVMANMTPVADMRDAALAMLPETLSAEQRRQAEREIEQNMIARLQRRNLWTCNMAQQNPCLVALIGLDPIMNPNLMGREIVDKVENQGAMGIKVQNAVQRFYPHDRRMWLAYETTAELGLPFLFHSGGVEPLAQFAEPRLFAEVAASFPGLTMVLAHLGMFYWKQAVELAKNYPNVNFDCSAAIGITEEEGGLSDEALTAMIREIGIDRVMFGSDYHWFDPISGIQRLLRLKLSDEERRLILGENARRVYKLS